MCKSKAVVDDWISQDMDHSSRNSKPPPAWDICDELLMQEENSLVRLLLYSTTTLLSL